MPMKITFRVAVVNGKKIVLPLAEFGSEEEKAKVGEVKVALSRSGSSCIYPLSNMDAHAGHTPTWRLDGSAPVGSSAMDQTIDTYIQRITDQVKERVTPIYGASEIPTSVTVETKEITSEEAFAILGSSMSKDEDDGEDEDEDEGGKGVDWKKYGI